MSEENAGGEGAENQAESALVLAGESEAQPVTEGAQQEQAAQAADDFLRLVERVDAINEEAGWVAAVQVTVSVSAEQGLAEIMELIVMPMEMAGMHRVAAIWNEEARIKVADRAVKVLRKYAIGRKFLAWLEQGIGIDEIALLMVLSPMVKATISAARADLMEIRAGQQQAA